MYKVLITFLLALGCGRCVYAQKDTIYFNAKWKVTNRENKSYYRLYEKTDSGYKVWDYYLTGQMQMSGLLTSLDTADKKSKNGFFVFYDSAGHKLSEGIYKEEKRNGLWRFYYRGTGDIRSEHSYEKNELNGHTVHYDSLTHFKLSEGDFLHDKAVGKWVLYRENQVWIENIFDGDRRDYTAYYQNGNVKEKAVYKNGRKKSARCFDFSGKPIECPQYSIQYTSGQQVTYPTYDLHRYIKNTFYYPQYAKELGISGPVKLRFCINEDGTVSDVAVVQGIGGGCDEEAMRIIKNMPRWNPRITNNMPEKSIVTYTIVF